MFVCFRGYLMFRTNYLCILFLRFIWGRGKRRGSFLSREGGGSVCHRRNLYQFSTLQSFTSILLTKVKMFLKYEPFQFISLSSRSSWWIFVFAIFFCLPSAIWFILGANVTLMCTALVDYSILDKVKIIVRGTFLYY